MQGIAEAFQSVSGATRGATESALRQLDRTGYRAQQISLAISLGLLVRALHYVLQHDGSRTKNPTLEDLEHVRRRYLALIEQDLANVERGYYPRDLLFQIPFGEYARLLPAAIADLPRIIARRRRGHSEDLPEGIDRSRYPAYYLRNFHWQTDGWLSERSAGLYDFSVEVLFQGTADVMRRMVIPPVVDAVREASAARRGEASPEPVRILDIACGTGRFLAQLHRALPDARLYGLDLSPYYIAKAKKVLSGVPDATLLVENAEAIPLKEGFFDVVTSVFLFHELPKDARRNVIREAYRLLKPGGRLVICDSAQPAESAELDVFFRAFEVLYHEPYFKSYLRDDLTRALTELGFESAACSPFFLSKVVVARKPPLSSRDPLG